MWYQKIKNIIRHIISKLTKEVSSGMAQTAAECQGFNPAAFSSCVSLSNLLTLPVPHTSHP